MASMNHYAIGTTFREPPPSKQAKASHKNSLRATKSAANSGVQI
jgi:hypothetical protein